jgi:hypothetical protein
MASASEQQPERPVARPAGRWPGAGLGSRRADRRRVPLWLSVVVLALTCLSLLASTLAVWIDATLLNTDRFVALVAPIGHDSQVIDGMSRYVADQVVVALAIPQRTASALPASGQFLVRPLEQSVHNFVLTRTAALLSNDKLQTTRYGLVRSLHAELVTALRGQSSTVTITNGALTVDLLPLIAAALRQLQQADHGLVPSRLAIPTLTGAQSPQQERQALARALGVPLAPDFGMVTLLHSDRLTTVQRLVSVLDALRVILPVVTLALVVAAIWTAADRRRALLLLGIGIAASFLAAIPFVQLLLGQFAAAAQASPAREIADTLVGLVRVSLVAVLVAVVIAGSLVAFGAHLAGQPEWLVRRLPTVAGAGRAEPAGPPSRGSLLILHDTGGRSMRLTRVCTGGRSSGERRPLTVAVWIRRSACP